MPIQVDSVRPADAKARIQRALDTRLVQHWPYSDDTKSQLLIEASGAGAWTVKAKRGYVHVEPRAVRKPSATVYADARTLAEVLEGARSGVEVWLKGYLNIRGNIALALKLEGLLKEPRPKHFPRPRRVRAAGIDTFYLEAGNPSDTAVFLLHGLSATGASMLPTLPVLAQDHRVIVPDLPGFGDSSKPLRDYHAEFFSKWVVAMMDQLRIRRAILIGNSMGGRISIETALRYPDRVDRIILYCPAVAFRKLRQAVPLVRLLRPELGITPLRLPRKVAFGVMQNIFSQPDRVPTPWYDSAADEFFRIFNTKRGRIALFSAAKQIYLDDPWGKRGFWERLATLSRPALFLWGDRDVLVPSGFHRHVKEAVPGAHSIVIEDCGHVPQFELPEVIHPMVREFIETGAVTPPDGSHL